MADSGIFRLSPLQGWQRDAVLKAASFIREKYGNPPSDASARMVHDGLLEVLDPSRRTVRLQKELAQAARSAVLTTKTERRTGRDRRRSAQDRRTVNLGPPPGTAERRKGDRRAASRRTRK
jgi:hypothetical protein